MVEVEHRKAIYEARTLDSDIVRDGVFALSHLDSVPFSQESYFLVGGVATQSYLPSSTRRPTGDIDFACMKPLSFSDFKRFVEPAADVLRALNYDINFFRGHITHKLIYGNEDKGQNLIETSKVGATKFSSYSAVLDKEFARTRQKNIESRAGTIRVCSPEDIIVPKLSRSAQTLERQPDLRLGMIEYASQSVDDDFIKKSLRNLKEIKEEVISAPADIEIASRLRFGADVYDVKLLSVLTGYNEQLLLQTFKDWPYIRDHPNEINFLAATLLPNLAFDIE